MDTILFKCHGKEFGLAGGPAALSHILNIYVQTCHITWLNNFDAPLPQVFQINSLQFF